MCATDSSQLFLGTTKNDRAESPEDSIVSIDDSTSATPTWIRVDKEDGDICSVLRRECMG